MLPTLRTGFEILESIGGVDIVVRVLRGTSKWGYKTFLDSVGTPGRRRELVSELFLSKGEFLFHPGTDWRPAPGQTPPPYRGRGYPHEIRALRSFVPFLPEKNRYQETLFFPANLDPSSRLVSSGIPKVNSFVRAYLPSVEITDKGVRQQFGTFLSPTSLRYLFGEDLVHPRVRVVSMMETGAIREKTRKLVWKWKGKADLDPWRPKGYLDNEQLEKDFLLVSRLPRTHIGGDILILAGGHGAGTESVNLLLHDLPFKELRKLVDTLGGADYYQFVVEVTEIRHTKSGTIPKRIQISEELPPVRLDISAGALRKMAIKDKAIC